VPDLDMAGARGSAYAARNWLITQSQQVKPAALLPSAVTPGRGMTTTMMRRVGSSPALS
jgi:hypothetical protein